MWLRQVDSHVLVKHKTVLLLQPVDVWQVRELEVKLTEMSKPRDRTCSHVAGSGTKVEW